MACDPDQTCPICDQQGLPIFPVRYAVARATGVREASQAPRLQAPFEVAAVELPEQLAHYTLRLSRQGYIYVFNEGRKEWSGYIVTDSAHLLPFDVSLSAPPAAESAAPCSRMAQSQAGRCIMIPDAHDPSRLGKVWLAFTPSAWTQATLEKHGCEKYRARHMRCFDAAAWVASNGGASQPHAAPFFQSKNRIAELAQLAPLAPGVGAALPGALRNTVRPVFAYPAFTHSHTPSVVLDGAAVSAMEASILQAVEFRVPRATQNLPVAISLDDPSGIVADLNELIRGLASEWLSEPERAEKLETAATIDAIKKAVQNGAAEEARQTRRNRLRVVDSISRMIAPTATRSLAGPRDQEWSDRLEMAAELSDEEREEEGRRRWNRYREMLKGASASEQADWQRYLEQVFPAEHEAFCTRVLNPLDEAYVKWLGAAQMKNYFKLNFDTEHFLNGIDYANAFYTLVREASGRAKVFDHLKDQLAADPLDENAFVVRALIGNHRPAIELWTGPGELQVPTGSEPDWAAAGIGLLSEYAKLATTASSGSLDGPLNSLGRVAMELGGPMLKWFGDGFDKIVGGLLTRTMPEHRILSLLTMLGQTDASPKRVIAIHAQVTRKQAARTLSGMLAHLSGEQDQVFRSGSRIAYDRLPSVGDPRVNIRGFVVVDERTAEALGHRRAMGLSRSGHLQAVTRTLEPLEFDHAMQRASRELLNAEFRGHLVGALLVSLTLSSAWQEMMKSGVGSNTATANFGAGVAALTSSMFESTAAVAQRTSWGASALGRPIQFGALRLATRAQVVGFAGRLLGALAGVVVGVLGIWEGYKSIEISETYGVAMIALGGIGLVAGVVFFLFAGAAATVAFIVGVVIACLMVIVGFFKPDEIQVWLARSRYFGIRAGGSFASLNDQRRALDEIISVGER